jgi:hypothetical protein
MTNVNSRDDPYENNSTLRYLRLIFNKNYTLINPKNYGNF